MLKKVSIIASLALSSVCALEFGTMGNTAASMGGAGVAMKNSAFGLYYNPALLSASPKVKFGYSVGASVQERNIAQMIKIDLANMQSTATRLADSFGAGGNGSTQGAVSGVVDAINNALNDVLGSSATGSTQDKLTSYINNKKDGNYSDLIDKIKENINNSNSLDGVQKSLISNIAGSIDYENLDIGSVAGAAQNAIKSVSISKGADKGLDKSMNDLKSVQDALKNNHLSVISQNGVVLQIGSRPMNNAFGTIAIGFFGSLYSNISIKPNENMMDIIVKAGNQYYKLDVKNDEYTYSQTTQTDYEQHSIIAALEPDAQDPHQVYFTSFVLSEIPLGYAHTFYLRNGNINFGVAGKAMNSFSVQKSINISKNTDFSKELKGIASDFKNAQQDGAFGVDAGVLYEIDLPKFRYLTLGLVGKNLNSPTFKSTLEGITIKPQYRAGIGYHTQNGFNLAFDADLSANEIIAFSSDKQKSQMIGGGAGFIWKGFDLRAGAMKDLRQDNGVILTGGINILGFLDLALQSSTKFTQVQNIPVPQYFSVRLGGSFSW